VLVETPSLLITDDDDAFRETLREVFEPRGFRTLLACDGEQALQIARSKPVHLLLTDLHMPRLSGLETIRRIHRLRAPLPCILISARLDDCIAEQARQAQVFWCLKKPVRFRELTTIVQHALHTTYGWTAEGIANYELRTTKEDADAEERQ
jgi:CheY-like chemotaxis protein